MSYKSKQQRKYMIGQRVIYQNTICTIVPPELDVISDQPDDEETIWIDNPEKGYKHWCRVANLKPLPKGQL